MGIASRSNPLSDDAGYRGLQFRGRWEALGQVSAELMHDLAMGLGALEARARLAAAEARAGRTPLADLDQVVETSGDLKAMVADTLDVVQGRGLSPEGRSAVRGAAGPPARPFFPPPPGGGGRRRP